MIKIGIIGCGKIAQMRHIPEYAANPNVELAGFYDINQKRAADLAIKYGGQAYDSLQALLAADIDAVSVCTPNYIHAENTIAALKASKHVLCEKPMAGSIQDCEDMLKAAREAGRFLMLGHNQRLAKAHMKARELIQSGLIGDIVNFRTTFFHGGPEFWSIDPGPSTWFFDKSRALMGVMADLGIHKTDLIHYLTGQTIVETTARLSTIDKKYANGTLIDVDDNAICIFRLRGGAVGTMSISWTSYGAEDNSTVLYGTRGIMRLYDDPTYSIKVTTRERENVLYQLDGIQTNERQTRSGVIDTFVSCILENREPEISGEEVLKSMRVVFASIESSKTGQAVKVNEN
jgi:predicted dehydrogenase